MPTLLYAVPPSPKVGGGHDRKVGGHRKKIFPAPEFVPLHFQFASGASAWDDLRKILPGCRQMTNVLNGVETLPKISIAWVGCTNVTDRQTDGRTTTAENYRGNDSENVQYMQYMNILECIVAVIKCNASYCCSSIT